MPYLIIRHEVGRVARTYVVGNDVFIKQFKSFSSFSKEDIQGAEKFVSSSSGDFLCFKNGIVIRVHSAGLTGRAFAALDGLRADQLLDF